jgi:hypothetical protein
VKLFITSGTVDNPSTAIETLFQGYIDNNYNPTWPSYRAEHASEGKGNIRTIIGTDPAAGVNLSETVPTNARWRLLSLNLTMTTDATVANRNMRIFYDDGVTTFFATESLTLQTASQSRRYVIAAFGNGQAVTIDTIHLAAPPDIELLAGYRVRSSVANFQVEDNINEFAMLVEEWLDA